MKTNEGYRLCYNVQTGVNKTNYMITYARVTQDTFDRARLAQNIQDQIEEINLKPQRVVADKGYSEYSEVAKVKELEIECFVPNKTEKKSSFVYDEQEDTYTCPGNRKLHKYKNTRKLREKLYWIYRTKSCIGCPHKITLCRLTVAKTKDLYIEIGIDRKKADLYREEMTLPESKKVLNERKSIVEHPFGTIKRLFGKMGFIAPGIESAQTETDLITTCYNIKRLLNITPLKEVLQKLEVYFNCRDLYA